MPETAALEMTGRLVGRGREVNVAPPAAAPPRHHAALAVAAQIGEQPRVRVVVDHGSGRHAQDGVLPALAVPVLVAPSLAGLGAMLVAIAEIEQRGEPLVHFQDHAAAIATIAAGRTTLGHELLAAPGHGAIAAVTATDVDARLIDEGGHARVPLPASPRGAGEGAAKPRGGLAGVVDPKCPGLRGRRAQLGG